jgi:hypothetical protein
MTTILPKRMNTLLNKIFVWKGIPSSIAYVSPEKRLSVRPEAVFSKNTISEYITLSNKSLKITRLLFKLLYVNMNARKRHSTIILITITPKVVSN